MSNGDSVTAQVLGGLPKILSLEDVETVEDVKLELNCPKHTATVNDETVDDDYELSNREWVLLSPPVKGGSLLFCKDGIQAS